MPVHLHRLGSEDPAAGANVFTDGTGDVALEEDEGRNARQAPAGQLLDPKDRADPCHSGGVALHRDTRLRVNGDEAWKAGLRRGDGCLAGVEELFESIVGLRDEVTLKAEVLAYCLPCLIVARQPLRRASVRAVPVRDRRLELSVAKVEGVVEAEELFGRLVVASQACEDRESFAAHARAGALGFAEQTRDPAVLAFALPVKGDDALEKDVVATGRTSNRLFGEEPRLQRQTVRSQGFGRLRRRVGRRKGMARQEMVRGPAPEGLLRSVVLPRRGGGKMTVRRCR